MQQVQVGNGTVRLAGRDLQLVGQVQAQDLKRFQSKITFGDYSHDSDALLSTWVLSSLVGGIGNEELKEAVDDETYWTGNLETRYPGMLTLGAYTWRFPGPVGSVSSAYPLADFPAKAPALWAMFDETVARWSEPERQFHMMGQLAGVPTNKAVEYNHLLWIPLGINGYATVDDGGTITEYTDLNIMAFTVWDNKLAALTSEGVLRLKTGDTAWEADNPALHLPSSARPRNLVVFINQQQDATIHIITHRDVWAYDRTNQVLFRTHLQYPPHPDQGKASTVWRGESLYVSVGLGIHAYNGGIINAMGPDGRYGLPAYLRGTITDLEPEYNALIAVIEGQKVADDPEMTVRVDPRQYEDPLLPYPDLNAYSTVLRWTGYGWHPLWISPDRAGVPTWATVSEADNRYRVWWGYGEDMYYQDLPLTFHNPKAGMEVGVNDFADTGSLTTGWFDADMKGFDKLASHAEVHLEDVFRDGTPTGTVTVQYQVDDDPGWNTLGVAEYVGMTRMPFNLVDRESSDEFSAGLRFRRIRFRFRFTSTQVKHSPVMTAFVLKFIKIPLAGRSWVFTVRNDQIRDFMGQGPMETAEWLQTLAGADEFHEFLHRDEAYRVRVAQTSSNENSGYDGRSTVRVNVVEVPMAPSQIRMPVSG